MIRLEDIEQPDDPKRKIFIISEEVTETKEEPFTIADLEDKIENIDKLIKDLETKRKKIEGKINSALELLAQK